MVLKKANVNREEVSQVVKDKINEFALRGFRALGVSVADGDHTGADECATLISDMRQSSDAFDVICAVHHCFWCDARCRRLARVD